MFACMGASMQAGVNACIYLRTRQKPKPCERRTGVR